jgi:hypothetical protein
VANKVPTEKAKIQAYIGDALKNELSRDAERNDRSLSAEITSILEKYKDSEHFLIRVPERVREIIQNMANEDNRSVENLIEWIIIQYVNSRIKKRN